MNYNLSRANRMHYWLASLIICGFGVIAGWIAFSIAEILGGLIFVAIYLICIFYNVKLHILRLHDINQSGWWFLAVFIPVIGPLGLLIVCGFFVSVDENNRFGAPNELEFGEFFKEFIRFKI